MVTHPADLEAIPPPPGEAQPEPPTPLKELRPAHAVMVTAYVQCRDELRHLNDRHVTLSKELDKVRDLSGDLRRTYDDLYAALTEAGVDPDGY